MKIIAAVVAGVAIGWYFVPPRTVTVERWQAVYLPAPVRLGPGELCASEVVTIPPEILEKLTAPARAADPTDAGREGK